VSWRNESVIVEPILRREVMTIDELQRELRKHSIEWEDVARVQEARLNFDWTDVVRYGSERLA
jgi:hypothetical protein